jgi:hypothetical protein
MSTANSAVLALVGPVVAFARSARMPLIWLRSRDVRLYQQDAVTAGQFMGAGTVGWELPAHHQSTEKPSEFALTMMSFVVAFCMPINAY